MQNACVSSRGGDGRLSCESCLDCDVDEVEDVELNAEDFAGGRLISSSEVGGATDMVAGGF